MKLTNIKSYAVVQDGYVVSLEYTRECARVRKARMGGKENGVTIVQLKAAEEVR